jgi:hypothetical protein
MGVHLIPQMSKLSLHAPGSPAHAKLRRAGRSPAALAAIAVGRRDV